MARIRCFLLEPTGQAQVKLRRYAHVGDCPLGYHDASTFFRNEPEVTNDEGYLCHNSVGDVPSHDDPRWPRQCSGCSYLFREEDVWQRFTERLYRRKDTGEEMTLRDAPPGAMWEAWWFDDMWVPQGKHNLVVRTPGGDWTIDGCASNCGMPDDRGQKKHHCWIREGIPPDVTVSKNGVSCSAGAGSIQCRDYHGFLRNGWLED